ncbi:murein L,D-transpeptidase [Chitinophaga sp. 30R24]|uniref:L,D-transpeptidase family protein n=1 Tax=Chitinophaga sp. 30R24 TaxID=3248838 RepID=UPI003B91DB2F
MKRLSLFTLLVYYMVLLWACGSFSTPSHTDAVVADSLKSDPITPLNTAITPENAYNDLFLDSSAITKFIASENLDAYTANRMRSFYNARNYEFAWLDSRGAVEQAAAFRSLYNYSKDTMNNKALDRQLDALVDKDSLGISATDASAIHTELELTWRLINYFKETSGSVTQLEHMVPTQRYPAMELADSMLQTDDAMYPAVAPMKASLKIYMDIVRQGGWEPVGPVKGLRQGQSSPLIPAIKQRLWVTGYLPENDSSKIYTEALETAVNTFRSSHGYKPTGILNDTVIRELNVPADTRLQQLLVNMERMKWMPAAPKGKLILVNIPAFVLHVTDDGRKLFDMDIVVGKEGHSTTMFSGVLNQVVFSPYWNVPRSIIRKEILPAMGRNKGYLAAHHMEITGRSGGVPVIRQLPGPHNALGRVKFLFPNSYNIYFHDTPDKGLFARDNRAYSHGCIRLKEPVKMAQFVLEDQPEWTDERMDDAMNSGRQRFVAVKNPVPVIITYYTAWVDDDGQLCFASDVYGHDEVFKKKLFK